MQSLSRPVSIGAVPVWNAALWAVAAVALGAYVWIFMLSPMNGEDYALTRVFDGQGLLERLAWIVERAQLQAREWNARLGEMLAIFWLSMPAGVFTLVAAFTFVAFAYLVARVVPAPESGSNTAFALAALFALWPGMELFFWRTVQAGYLQPLTITLACFYCYRDDAAIRRIAQSPVWCGWVALLGLLAGLSFENTPVALLVFLTGSLLLAGREVIGVRTVLPLLTTAIGWLVLVTAPSTTHRRHFYAEVFGGTNPDFDYYWGRAVDVATVFYLTGFWLIVPAGVALAYLLLVGRGVRLRLLLLVLSAVLLVGSVAAAPYTEPRAFSLAWALMAAVVLGAVNRLFHRHAALRPVIVLAAAGMLYFAVVAYGHYADFAARVAERDALIAQQSTTPACREGIRVPYIDHLYPYRYLNNRDIWVRDSPAYMQMYHGCVIVTE